MRDSYTNNKFLSRDEVLTFINGYDEKKDKTIYRLTDIMEWDAADPINFSINLGQEKFMLYPWAKSQFLKKLSIPGPYFDICSTELRNKELTEAISNLNTRGAEMQFKFINDGVNKLLYGIVAKQYFNILSGLMVESLFNFIPERFLTVEECGIDYDEIRLRLIYSDLTFEQGDVYYPFLDFRFSEVARKPLMFSPGIMKKEEIDGELVSESIMLPETAAKTFKMSLMRYKEDVYLEQLRHLENLVELEEFAIAMEKFKNISLPKANLDEDEADEDLDSYNAFKLAYDMVMPSKFLRKDFGDAILNSYNDSGNLTLNGLCIAISRIASGIITSADKESLESTVGKFVANIIVAERDAKEHGEVFEYSIPNFVRKFKLARKHAS